MRLSFTLSTYIARHFLSSIALVLLVLVGLVALIDAVELLRRSSSREAATFFAVTQMALLRTPYLAQKIIPFAQGSL